MKSKAILLALLIATLIVIPIFPVSSGPTDGPYEDNLHIINYGDPDTESAALEAGSIDITDWPLIAYWIDKWVDEGRVPSEITLCPYAEVGTFEFDINNQRWPTGSDGVAAREGYTGTYTRGAYTWNQFHTRQRPETSVGMHPPAYNPGTQTAPMGDGADYDPETASWKTYFDEDCLWDVMAWGLRLAVAYLTDKDYIINTILEGLGSKMIAWACSPSQTGYLDVANLTGSSFVYHGPLADVTIPSLEFGRGMTRPQAEAKADELLNAAGFVKYGGNSWRSDPRKMVGANGQYDGGTGDDVTDATSQMSPITLYTRLDDPMRNQAGLKLGSDLTNHFVRVTTLTAEKAICFSKVMVEYDYHIYTGGYSFGVDPVDISYYLWHSSQYWYPVGWSGGYQGFAHELCDAYLTDVKESDDYDTILAGFRNSTFLTNKYVASIPLWSSASAMAYRTGWEGVVNHAGYGPTWGTGGVYYWSLFNMRKDTTNTINLGFKTSPEGLSVVSSEWVWDYIVLDAMYESLLVRNPFDLSRDRGMLATSWSTGLWSGGIYVDYTLKSGVKWHDGTTLTAEDVKWSIEFQRDCGVGVAWNYASVKDITNVTVTASGEGGSVRVYFDTPSYWAVHMSGYIEILSRKIWMNASAQYGWGYDPTKPPGVGAGKRWPTDAQRMMVRNYAIYQADIYDPNSATPHADGTVDLAQDGTGPWKFVGYVGPIDDVETIDLVAFRDHHLSQAEVTAYLEGAFNEVGNVNYPGSVNQGLYNFTDRVIDEPDIILMTKAYLAIPTDPHGINWTEWNVDADINHDLIVDDLDLAVANFFYGRAEG